MPDQPRGTRRTLVLIAVPLFLLIVAALARLPDLATRGTWDADQGHDMLVLRALVRDGTIPLLGPPTSIGDVHHGALYYYALSPAAFLTGGDSPLAVAALIALAGIAAVLVTWWLARSMAGPVAGFVAGLAMAISTSAIDESTFIWNPNLIALSSAVALAGAWRAWTTGRPAWWLVAAVGTGLTMQFHVLGVTMLPIVGALLSADARNRPAGPERRRIWRYGAAGLVIVALGFTPLVIHELTNDFSEVNAALAYIRNGGDPTGVEPLARLLIIGARVLSWPLTGLLTDAAAIGLFAAISVVAIVVWRALAGEPRERGAAVWLGLGLAWTAICLTFLSPSLASVVPGLPNDHYHAFADPMVFAIVGMGAGGLWRISADLRGARAAIGPVLTVVAVGALVVWNVTRLAPVRGARWWIPGGRPSRGAHHREGRHERHHTPLAARLQVGRGVRLSPRPSGRNHPRRHRLGPHPAHTRHGRRRLRCPLRNHHRRHMRRPSRIDRRATRPLRPADRPLRSRPRPHHLHLPHRPVSRQPGAPVTRRVEAARGTVRRSAVGATGGFGAPGHGRRESRTPAPQTPAFAAPRPGSWRANPGRALVCASNAPGRDRRTGRPDAPY